jgi:hypothetical protein
MSESRSARQYESWVSTKWRPVTAWTYTFVCLFDFVLAPVGLAALQSYLGISPLTMWKPLTLEGGGLYHLSMGAIVGVTAWTRSQEKIEETRAAMAPPAQ